MQLTNLIDLELRAISKSYVGVVAVDKVDLTIKRGQLVAFLGPSGCGKTSTLRIIAGLTDPTTGQVLIGGMDVTQKPAHRRNIGMLFQNYALFPHLTIAQNIAFGLRMRKVGKDERNERVRAALELVQLTHLADRQPGTLSGGQQQRVALARAIVIEPSLLLLDEPLGALDKNLRESMQVELRQIQRRLNITTVLVTHDQDEALTMADQIVVMNKGRIEQIGSPTEIYMRPTSRFVAGFIGTSNFLSGDIINIDENTCRIRLPGGGEVTFNSSLQKSGSANITVRPESIRISTETQDVDTGNWTKAIIEDVMYRGQFTHVLMRRMNGEAMLAYLPPQAAAEGIGILERGAKVIAYWQRYDNHCLQAE